MERVTTDAATGEVGRIVEAEPESIQWQALRRDLTTWEARAMVAEAALRSRLGHVLIIRGDWEPHVGRVQGYVRLEDTLSGSAVFLDADALRLACREIGLVLR